jgi:predicted nucleic acid-binding protein
VKVIVSDAGPIISAARAGKLELLRSVVENLMLPLAVYNEIVIKGAGKPGAQPEALAEWTTVKALAQPDQTVTLPVKLGDGEREAILLAEELGAVLLMDDPDGRMEATSRGLEVVGTLGVLREAKVLGLIEEVKPVLDEYRASGYRIKDSLYQRFLQTLGE